MKGINLEMSEWQTEQMKDLIAHTKKQFKNGTPGILLAQIWIDPAKKLPGMEIKFIGHEKAKKMQAAIGQTVGKVAKGEKMNFLRQRKGA